LLKNASVSVKVANVKRRSNLDFVANKNSSQNKNCRRKKSGSNQCTCEGVTCRTNPAIMRGDAININAQAAEAGYLNAKSDYNRFENAYKTGGVTNNN
jgi:hypothetical protein